LKCKGKLKLLSLPFPNTATTMAKYKRILLKLSGESLAGNASKENTGGVFDPTRLVEYARQIQTVSAAGVPVAIGIGGGTLFRGLSGVGKGFDRVRGDQMGMLATIINSLALQSALEAEGVKAVTLTSVATGPVGAGIYSKFEALRYLGEGYVVIIGGGTGNPFFTTDTASALRGVEIQADVLLKGTRVDGVSTADPERDQSATKYATISFAEVIEKRLKVMDLTAFTMCMENDLPILVFDMDTVGNLERIVIGGQVELGTLVHNN
jgi:uridylate kinase